MFGANYGPLNLENVGRDGANDVGDVGNDEGDSWDERKRARRWGQTVSLIFFSPQMGILVYQNKVT
jgi:hypothetical protein